MDDVEDMQVVEDIVCASRIGKAVQNGICKSGKCAMRIELGKCKGQSAEGCRDFGDAPRRVKSGTPTRIDAFAKKT